MLLPMKQPEYLVGFVVAFVKNYLEIQVGFGAVLFCFVFYICYRKKKNVIAQSSKALERKWCFLVSFQKF